MHPEVPAGLLNFPRDLFLRNQDAISLASWVSFHLLKPVHPANDLVWQVMPWREDVAFWDEQGKTAFLDDPSDYDLTVSDETTDPYDPEVPLLLKAYQAMATGGLSTAARYHYFELATNPRMGDADRILSAVSNALCNSERCINGRLTSVFEYGPYVIGPLGIIERVEHDDVYEALADANALPGTLHEFSLIIQNCEHCSIGIFEAPLFDMETIGWSSQWSQWFGDQDFVLPNDSASEEQVIAMLGFRKHWHPDSWQADRAAASRMQRRSLIAALDKASQQELRVALTVLFQSEKAHVLENAIWLNASTARKAIEQNELDGLNSVELQQILLLVNHQKLAAHFNVESTY